MDYHSDIGRRRLAVLSQTLSCDLQKTAAAYESSGSQELDNLPPLAFADPINRLYPVHTKEAAVLSFAYFLGEHADGGPQSVRQGLEKAASFWQVDDEWQQMQRELSERQPPKYALDLQLGGAVLRHFPWHDRPSLEKTAQDFRNNRHNLPRAARLQTADNLLAAQGELQAKFAQDDSQWLDRCAGFGLPDFDRAAEMLLDRSQMLRRQPEHRPLLQKLAQVLQALQEQPDSQSLKLAADAFSAFDEETGLARRYGRGLELPEDQLTAVTCGKYAADREGTVQLANGLSIRLADIDWQKVAEFDPALAEAVGGSTEKAAEVLPTWPRPDADLLIDMLGLQTV